MNSDKEFVELCKLFIEEDGFTVVETRRADWDKTVIFIVKGSDGELKQIPIIEVFMDENEIFGVLCIDETLWFKDKFKAKFGVNWGKPMYAVES